LTEIYFLEELVLSTGITVNLVSWLAGYHILDLDFCFWVSF